MILEDFPDNIAKAAHISNLSPNACPFPELINMGREDQWVRVLRILSENGLTVIEKDELGRIRHWAGLD